MEPIFASQQSMNQSLYWKAIYFIIINTSPFGQKLKKIQTEDLLHFNLFYLLIFTFLNDT